MSTTLQSLSSDYKGWHRLSQVKPVSRKQKEFLTTRTENWCWRTEPGYTMIFIKENNVASDFSNNFANGNSNQS